MASLFEHNIVRLEIRQANMGEYYVDSKVYYDIDLQSEKLF